jgi:hypothetical protein
MDEDGHMGFMANAGESLSQIGLLEAAKAVITAQTLAPGTMN